MTIYILALSPCSSQTVVSSTKNVIGQSTTWHPMYLVWRAFGGYDIHGFLNDSSYHVNKHFSNLVEMVSSRIETQSHGFLFTARNRVTDVVLSFAK